MQRQFLFSVLIVSWTMEVPCHGALSCYTINHSSPNLGRFRGMHDSNGSAVVGMMSINSFRDLNFFFYFREHLVLSIEITLS
ncbi:hypothetical protein CEXT_339561 [Caerostris extrusa]|uniref:Secreted protein n=1 Tax=Caerostris extrusa TaxID=172846 RepID=A0AAV4TUF6_CAEEX|nr:hypothetical protein CEXT_339561 [Caerostris extrusa]